MTVYYKIFPQVLYRLKEKEFLDQQLKDPSSASRELTPVPVHGVQPLLTLKNSMVQANQTSTSSAINTTNSNSPSAPSSSIHQTHSSVTSEPQCPPAHTVTELKPCWSSTHSPFKMKPVAGLQERYELHIL